MSAMITLSVNCKYAQSHDVQTLFFLERDTPAAELMEAAWRSLLYRNAFSSGRNIDRHS